MLDLCYRQQHPVLYYGGTVEYFRGEHIPFAVLASIVLLLFTFLPILLCLYPCQCFHRFLNRYHINSPALHQFMDTFQGYYKDGTNGTRDYRYFVALFLILRVIVNISLVLCVIIFSNVYTCLHLSPGISSAL